MMDGMCRVSIGMSKGEAERMLARAGGYLGSRFAVEMSRDAAQANIDARSLLLRARLDLIDEWERETKSLPNASE